MWPIVELRLLFMILHRISRRQSSCFAFACKTIPSSRKSLRSSDTLSLTDDGVPCSSLCRGFGPGEGLSPIPAPVSYGRPCLCKCSAPEPSQTRLRAHPQIASKYQDRIKVYFSSRCDSITRLPGGSGIEVKASLRDTDAGTMNSTPATFHPHLVVGADGLKSMVRLSTWS